MTALSCLQQGISMDGHFISIPGVVKFGVQLYSSLLNVPTDTTNFGGQYHLHIIPVLPGIAAHSRFNVFSVYVCSRDFTLGPTTKVYKYIFHKRWLYIYFATTPTNYNVRFFLRDAIHNKHGL